jgi:hypothetical protein
MALDKQNKQEELVISSPFPWAFSARYSAAGLSLLVRFFLSSWKRTIFQFLQKKMIQELGNLVCPSFRSSFLSLPKPMERQMLGYDSLVMVLQLVIYANRCR